MLLHNCGFYGIHSTIYGKIVLLGSNKSCITLLRDSRIFYWRTSKELLRLTVLGYLLCALTIALLVSVTSVCLATFVCLKIYGAT